MPPANACRVSFRFAPISSRRSLRRPIFSPNRKAKRKPAADVLAVVWPSHRSRWKPDVSQSTAPLLGYILQGMRSAHPTLHLVQETRDGGAGHEGDATAPGQRRGSGRKEAPCGYSSWCSRMRYRDSLTPQCWTGTPRLSNARVHGIT